MAAHIQAIAKRGQASSSTCTLRRIAEAHALTCRSKAGRPLCHEDLHYLSAGVRSMMKALLEAAICTRLLYGDRHDDSPKTMANVKFRDVQECLRTPLSQLAPTVGLFSLKGNRRPARDREVSGMKTVRFEGPALSSIGEEDAFRGVDKRRYRRRVIVSATRGRGPTRNARDAVYDSRLSIVMGLREFARITWPLLRRNSRFLHRTMSAPRRRPAARSRCCGELRHDHVDAVAGIDRRGVVGQRIGGSQARLESSRQHYQSSRCLMRADCRRRR